MTALLFAGPAGATNYSPQCPGDSGYLQTLLDTAPSGATITIYGTCYGNYTIDGSNTNNYGRLTLQGGSVGATLNGKGNGQVLAIENLADVTIRNLTIINGNTDGGGGIYCRGSELAMSNSTVKANRAFDGGGMLLDDCLASLTGVTVTRNTATYQGGGIDAYDSSLTITASTISQNKETSSGLVYGGGGIWLAESNAQLTSTRVTANTAGDYGGGIADYGGGFHDSTTLPADNILVGPPGLTLVNSSVDHNTAADDGGGIYNASEYGDSPVTLQGTTVSFNTARNGDGGGIYNYGENEFTASLLATGSTFQGNQAVNGEGGAVYNGVCVMVGFGTALATIARSPAATGPNLVNSNQAMYGGGFANDQMGNGVASLTLQSGATVRGNKALKTGGGVWNNCGNFTSLAQILLNTPNNVVSGCT